MPDPLRQALLQQLRVDVADVAPAGVSTVAAEVISPPGDLKPLTWWMLPGGSMTRRYWDLHAGDGTYSCAAFLADHGYRCVIVDHAGTGDSDVPDDPYELTPAMLAAIDVAAHQRVMADLGGAPTIGCGHSMGGMITVGAQAMARPHTALCLLGSSGRGLPQRLDDPELAYADRPDALPGAIAGLAHQRFGSGRIERPQIAADILAEAHAPLLTVPGLAAMIPGSFEPQIAAIDVPVMLARGEHDIAAPLPITSASFAAVDDMHLVEVAGMGHNHNASSKRVEMWQAMVDWAARLPI